MDGSVSRSLLFKHEGLRSDSRTYANPRHSFGNIQSQDEEAETGPELAGSFCELQV